MITANRRQIMISGAFLWLFAVAGTTLVALTEFGTRDALIAYAFATNTLFLLFHAAIGLVFLPRALALVSGMREARREGEVLPEPLLHDASDP